MLITNENNQHYVLIEDFNRFFYHQTKYANRKHGCMYCLQCFTTEEILNQHKENCMIINGQQAIKMPNKGEKIMLKNYQRQLKAPLVIFADFEAITEKVQSRKPNAVDSYTEAYQKHTDCSYAYKVVCCYEDKFTKPFQSHRGENAIYKFMVKMLSEVGYCTNMIKEHFNKPLKMKDEDEENFKQAEVVIT